MSSSVNDGFWGYGDGAEYRNTTHDDRLNNEMARVLERLLPLTRDRQNMPANAPLPTIPVRGDAELYAAELLVRLHEPLPPVETGHWAPPGGWGDADEPINGRCDNCPPAGAQCAALIRARKLIGDRDVSDRIPRPRVG